MKFLHSLCLLLILPAVGICLVAPGVRAEDPPSFVLEWPVNDYTYGGPYGIAVDSHGNIYAATGVHTMVKFNNIGMLLNSWTNLAFTAWAVAIDSQDQIFFTQDAQSVAKFTSNMELITSWPVEGAAGIAIDSQDCVYVVSRVPSHVTKFSNEGAFMTTWGDMGTLPGQFWSPNGITIDSADNVYVTDHVGEVARVQKFTSNGAWLTQWGSNGSGNGQFESPFLMAVDDQDNIFVIDYGNYRIEKFSSAGAFLSTWGSYGSEHEQFRQPFGIAVDSHNNIYVGDAMNHSIQRFGSITTATNPSTPLLPMLALPSPNPFNGQTTLRFSLPQESDARLAVYDVSGRKVADWEWSRLTSGEHSISWDGRAADGTTINSGIFFCRLTVDGQTQTRKLVHLK